MDLSTFSYSHIYQIMNKKITINKAITKRTTTINGFHPSKSEPYRTYKNNSVGSLRKPRKKRYAQTFD